MVSFVIYTLLGQNVKNTFSFFVDKNIMYSYILPGQYNVLWPEVLNDLVAAVKFWMSGQL